MWLLNWSEETLGITHQTDAIAKKRNINLKEITAMRIRKLSMALTTLITVGALLQRPARADEEKETTTITFSARSKFRVGFCRRGPTSSREWTTTTSGMWFRSLMRTIRCCMPCSKPTLSIA
jgi:hypothetical protein